MCNHCVWLLVKLSENFFFFLFLSFLSLCGSFVEMKGVGEGREKERYREKEEEEARTSLPLR